MKRRHVLRGWIASLALAAFAPEVPGAEPPSPASPWVLVESFWFFHRRADFADTEQQKIERVARFLAANPGAQLGIALPADDSGVEPGNGAINARRVQVLREALAKAGIPSEELPAGVLANREPTLNRQIQVFARNTGSPLKTGD